MGDVFPRLAGEATAPSNTPMHLTAGAAGSWLGQRL